MVAPLTVFADPAHDRHETPPGHPERPARLDAAVAGVEAAGLGDAAVWVQPELASIEAITTVHDPAYVESVRELCASGGGRIDADTGVSSGSFDTARQAAGAVLEAIGALTAGVTDVAFAAGRPPGHHAVADQAMGFCIFNNVAIGAASLVAAGNRVAIVDWDVHHGNGTQDIFYNEPNVLYISTHESPLYPGTGLLREQGGPHAPGTNVNIPLPAGSSGEAVRAAFDDVVIGAIERFKPDWLIISAGYDAHRNDPLSDLGLTSADYFDLATRLQPLVPKQRLLVVLEGGYDLDALTMSTGATLSALVGGSYRPEGASTGEVGIPSVTAARQLWERTWNGDM